ncbi:hypothetical protein K9O30_22495 [Clostridium bowmanii]|uniref:hypothetical protein n=1 Tax=Clostridium bowmanii TaxID=132925 RepID=UPI001C0CBA93|nr:hypothetical protein [Clostridium bowmanii]MBU3192214.1 hypothetical protein [Clostridium bowmanii]MCA1076426.1 hypothetical protein [Clostridium bowmanii]
MSNNKILHRITFLIIVLGILTSAIGLLYTTGGEASNFVNQYGDTVKIYGDGLYAHDSYFMAPISRGTDFTILFFAIPILILALVLDMKKKKLKNRMFLMSVISIFTYYSASIAFGVTYNIIHLVYIALFSASLFGLVIAIVSLEKKHVAKSMGDALPFKGIYIFLSLSGIALIVAWLPDIISSLIAGSSLELIEVYTTQVTYVIDMGIIAPVAFICLAQLKKRSGLGYILLAMLLTLCSIIGIMLPIQTVFQVTAGIEIPLAALVTKVASFFVLAFFSLYFNIQLFKNIKSTDSRPASTLSNLNQ